MRYRSYVSGNGRTSVRAYGKCGGKSRYVGQAREFARELKLCVRAYDSAEKPCIKHKRAGWRILKIYAKSREDKTCLKRLLTSAGHLRKRSLSLPLAGGYVLR